MSTDELVKGIRRIVEQDEKPKGLGDADALKPIGISRGIAYIGSGGSVRGSGAEGGGNDTEPPRVPDPVTTPDEGVPDEGGGTGTDSEVGGKTELTGDPAVVNDAATQNSKITSVTGTDPDTGTLTSVNFDSRAGIEYVPPDTWGSPTEPSSVTEGRSWIYSQGEGMEEEYYASREAAFNRIQEVEPSAEGTEFHSTSDPCVNFVIWGGTNVCRHVVYRIIYSGGRTATSLWQITTPDGETNLQGDIEWPPDSNCQIAYDHSSGGYKGNVLDPDCSSDQKKPSNCVIVRSQTQTSRYFRYCRLQDGGTKITEVDSGGTPVPGTITKIMDGAGNVTGFVDVSLDNFYQ